MAAQINTLGEIVREHGFPLWRFVTLAAKGSVALQGGHIEEATALLRAAIAILEASGIWAVKLMALLPLATTLIRSGLLEDAAALLAELHADLQQHSLMMNAVWISCLEGELLLRRAEPDRAGAEACFQDAIATARAQTAKSFELQAAMALAGLWAEQGERQKALDLLAPIYGWFTEGFDTPHLKQAKSLLDELR